MSKTYTAGWRYYFFLILFTATSLVGARAEYMLWTGQVSFGDDLTAGENRFLCIFAAVLLFFPLLSYARSSYYLWRQLIRYKGAVITLTDMGIENTLVFTWLFAFVFIRPVKLIPLGDPCASCCNEWAPDQARAGRSSSDVLQG